MDNNVAFQKQKNKNICKKIAHSHSKLIYHALFCYIAYVGFLKRFLNSLPRYSGSLREHLVKSILIACVIGVANANLIPLAFLCKAFQLLYKLMLNCFYSGLWKYCACKTSECIVPVDLEVDVIESQ